MCGQRHASAAWHPLKTRYPMYRRLGKFQGHEAGSKVKVWELYFHEGSLWQCRNVTESLLVIKLPSQINPPFLQFKTQIQGYSKRLWVYNCPAAIATKFWKHPPSDNSTRRHYAQFQETGCVCVRNWRYGSAPTLKPSPLTCGTNWIVVLMFVESQTVHI